MLALAASQICGRLWVTLPWASVSPRPCEAPVPVGKGGEGQSRSQQICALWKARGHQCREEARVYFWTRDSIPSIAVMVLKDGPVLVPGNWECIWSPDRVGEPGTEAAGG